MAASIRAAICYLIGFYLDMTAMDSRFIPNPVPVLVQTDRFFSSHIERTNMLG